MLPADQHDSPGEFVPALHLIVVASPGAGELAGLMPAPRRAPHDAVLLPRLEQPRQLVVPGVLPGLLGWLGLRQSVLTRLARTPAWRLTGRPGVLLPGGVSGLLADGTPAGAALRAAEQVLGPRGELRAILLGRNRVVVQVDLGLQQVAVRVAAGGHGPPWAARGDLEELSDEVPPVLAAGSLRLQGRTVWWDAEQWLPGTPGPAGRAWRARPPGPAWHALRLAAAAVGGETTGHVDQDLVAELTAVAGLRAPDMQAAVARALAPLHRERWPTTWCHGDPAPPNCLWDGQRARLVDWEGARRDAPAGVDVLILETVLLRAQRRTRRTGEGLAVLVQQPPRDLRPAGRSWHGLPPELRRAVAVAALIVNGDAVGGQHRPAAWWTANLEDLLADG